MLPTDLAAALCQELDSCEGLRVGLEAVADGNLLAHLHRDAADECQWGALVPHVAGRHTYMATAPLGPRSRGGRAPCDRRGAEPQKPSGAGPRATAKGPGPRSRVGQGSVRPPGGWAPEAEWGRAPCDH